MDERSYALITGATSGIGYELARQAAMDGYNLVLVARDEQELNKVKELLSQYEINILVIPKDLFVEESADEIYALTTSLGLNIEVLINNAGQGQYGKFVDEDLDRHLDIIRLNIMSLLSLTHYYMNDMLIRNKGMILQLGSEVSKMPGPLFAVYAATKAFVASFTEALINELDGTNVTMTLLMPGATDTDFFDKADMEHTKVYQESKMDPPEKVAEQAYSAMKAGERRIIGPAGKKHVAMATLTPDNILAKKQRKSMAPADNESSDARQHPDHERSREVHDKNADDF
jgi:uncharacterized protein